MPAIFIVEEFLSDIGYTSVKLSSSAQDTWSSFVLYNVLCCTGQWCLYGGNYVNILAKFLAPTFSQNVIKCDAVTMTLTLSTCDKKIKSPNLE